MFSGEGYEVFACVCMCVRGDSCVPLFICDLWMEREKDRQTELHLHGGMNGWMDGLLFYQKLKAVGIVL